MRDYAKVSPRFWTGDTGKAIRASGRDAQVVAAYLMTCPSANMIGLYYLPLPTLTHEIGISPQGALKALARLSEASFAYYEGASEGCYVPEMAAYQVGEPLSIKDNRVKGIIKEWQSMRKSPFFMDFYERYSVSFHLPKPDCVPPISKPLRSQEQEQEQEQENKQEQNVNTGARQNGFVKPTIEEVRAYCLERSNSVDPQAWIDHYTSNGWKVGRNRMTDWRAAVRTWENNLFGKHNGKSTTERVGPGQRFRPEAT